MFVGVVLMGPCICVVGVAFGQNFPKISTKHESFWFSLCVLVGSSLTPAMALEIRYAALIIFLAILLLRVWFYREYSPVIFSFSSGIFCAHIILLYRISFITPQRTAPRSSRRSPTSPSARLARSSAPAGGPSATRRRRPGRTSPSRC